MIGRDAREAIIDQVLELTCEHGIEFSGKNMSFAGRKFGVHVSTDDFPIVIEIFIPLSENVVEVERMITNINQKPLSYRSWKRLLTFQVLKNPNLLVITAKIPVSSKVEIDLSSAIIYYERKFRAILRELAEHREIISEAA